MRYKRRHVPFSHCGIDTPTVPVEPSRTPLYTYTDIYQGLSNLNLHIWLKSVRELPFPASVAAGDTLISTRAILLVQYRTACLLDVSHPLSTSPSDRYCLRSEQEARYPTYIPPASPPCHTFSDTISNKHNTTNYWHQETSLAVSSVVSAKV